MSVRCPPWPTSPPAVAADEHAAAVRCDEQVAPIASVADNRRKQALPLQRPGVSHFGRGDCNAALHCHAEAQAPFETLDEPIAARPHNRHRRLP